MTAIYLFQGRKGSTGKVTITFDAGPNYDVIAKFMNFDTKKIFQSKNQVITLDAGSNYYVAGVAAHALVSNVPPPRVVSTVTQAGQQLTPLYPKNLTNPFTIRSVFEVVGPVHKMAYPDIAIK